MKALHGTTVISLALNLPGPAALQRLKAMGARCSKFEPLAGDPMQSYETRAYEELHAGVRVLQADLKSEAGRKLLARELARTDVLLTSFRPSALKRLGLDWTALHSQYPALNLVSIVGAPGPLAEIPGHDLTYMAEQGLVQGLNLPPTLFADMGGALLASEAVLSALMLRQKNGMGTRHEVALTDAVAWLARPRHWGLTTAKGAVGGAHAGYRVYACKDGRVAVAALEPHFAQALCAAAGLKAANMLAPATRKALEAWFAQQTRRTLDALAQRLDLPLHTLPRN
ncbi:CoA transferase [Rhodoferax sp. BAB1]|uniref:CoA transferase n=1 Tax=Rhodoferax sp. BAB1 TaxID=2741720 RepID=UPI0015760D0B|nr:CoA transferase [Rhodoferax sp. BAB1]QKO21702.1 CoA transferase [Rhodoferax sp. BAB1]